MSIRGKFRIGKTRTHSQGYSTNIWKGDEILFCQTYGGSKEESQRRADILVELLNGSPLGGLAQ